MTGFWAQQGLTPSTVIPVYQYQWGIDVPLFWQQWKLDFPALGALAEAVTAVAAETLRPGPAS